MKNTYIVTLSIAGNTAYRFDTKRDALSFCDRRVFAILYRTEYLSKRKNEFILFPENVATLKVFCSLNVPEPFKMLGKASACGNFPGRIVTLITQ